MHPPNTAHAAHLSGNPHRPVIARGILTILALVVSMHALRAEDHYAAERAAWLADISTAALWTTMTPPPEIPPAGPPTGKTDAAVTSYTSAQRRLITEVIARRLDELRVFSDANVVSANF